MDWLVSNGLCISGFNGNETSPAPLEFVSPEEVFLADTQMKVLWSFFLVGRSFYCAHCVDGTAKDIISTGYWDRKCLWLFPVVSLGCQQNHLVRHRAKMRGCSFTLSRCWGCLCFWFVSWGLAPLVLCCELLACLIWDTASLCMKYSSDALHVGKTKGQTANHLVRRGRDIVETVSSLF